MPTFHKLSNRRGSDRQNVSFKTSIKVGDISTSCEIRDISTGGGRVKTSMATALQTQITLMIDQLGNFAGRVTWVHHGELGLKFCEPPERIAMALKLIATYGRH